MASPLQQTSAALTFNATIDHLRGEFNLNEQGAELMRGILHEVRKCFVHAWANLECTFILQELADALSNQIDHKRVFKVQGHLQAFKSLPYSESLPPAAQEGLGSAHTLLQLSCGQVTLKTPETAIHLQQLQCSAVEHEGTKRRRPPARGRGRRSTSAPVAPAAAGESDSGSTTLQQRQSRGQATVPDTPQKTNGSG